MIASLTGPPNGTPKDLPVVVTFFTNERYATCARELETSLLDAGMEDYDFQPRKSQGDHKTNLHQKIPFIREMLNKWLPRPILWVDADAYIRRWPSIFDSTLWPHGQIPFDFACAREDVGDRLEMLMGGTLFFAGTTGARLLLDLWDTQTQSTPKRYDFENLSRALECAGRFVTKYDLPPSYCWVERWFKDKEGPTSPIIEHLAISQG